MRLLRLSSYGIWTANLTGHFNRLRNSSYNSYHRSEYSRRNCLRRSNIGLEWWYGKWMERRDSRSFKKIQAASYWTRSDASNREEIYRRRGVLWQNYICDSNFEQHENDKIRRRTENCTWCRQSCNRHDGSWSWSDRPRCSRIPSGNSHIECWHQKSSWNFRKWLWRQIYVTQHSFFTNHGIRGHYH